MLAVPLAGEGVDPDAAVQREFRDQRLVLVQILQRFVEAAEPQEGLAARHERAQTRNAAWLLEEADEQVRRLLRLAPAHAEAAQALARVASLALARPSTTSVRRRRRPRVRSRGTRPGAKAFPAGEGRPRRGTRRDRRARRAGRHSVSCSSRGSRGPDGPGSGSVQGRERRLPGRSRARVRRPVVDEDQLETLVLLVLNARDRLLEMRLGVAEAHDHRHGCSRSRRARLTGRGRPQSRRQGGAIRVPRTRELRREHRVNLAVDRRIAEILRQPIEERTPLAVVAGVGEAPLRLVRLVASVARPVPARDVGRRAQVQLREEDLVLVEAGECLLEAVGLLVASRRIRALHVVGDWARFSSSCGRSRRGG